MIHIIQPFRSDKNLGKAYNDAMKLIPDGDHACIRDIDTLFLTPNTPTIIENYVSRYPEALLTCYTNRVSTLSKDQLYDSISENDEIRFHIEIAERQEAVTTVTPIRRCISGFLMVISKRLWTNYPFKETGHCLGIDTEYSRRLRLNEVPILRMDGVYLFHIYRLTHNIFYKAHLV